MTRAFVPTDFDIPGSYDGPGFRLEPLGPQHNEPDHAAWMSSIDHIRATPGFPDGAWPTAMPPEQNLADLERHARDFSERTGFTYTVLDGDEVIGCLYIYPSKEPGHDADVASWVRVTRSEMDVVVWQAVSAWMEAAWPFAAVDYAPRESPARRRPGDPDS